MSAKDELAKIAAEHTCCSGYCAESQSTKTADAILAAGYTKHRTVTTFEGLDALPVGAIVAMLDTGHVAIKSWQSKHPRKDGTPLSEWLVAGDDDAQGTYDLAFPATVLHEPSA